MNTTTPGKGCYGVVSISAKSKEGGASDSAADVALLELGFRQSTESKPVSEEARPAKGERFVLETSMVNRQAGNCWLYRAGSNGWERAFAGRIVNRSDASLSGISRFEIVDDHKRFSRMHINCGSDSIAPTIADVRHFDPKALAANLTISIDEHGNEVFGEDRVIRVDPYLIRRFKGNPRLIFKRPLIAALADNILEQGQHRPGVAMLIPESERTGPEMYDLTGGERRWEAIKMIWPQLQALGIEGMKLIIRKPVSTLDQLTLAFSDNNHAEPMSAYENIRAIWAFWEELHDVAEISRRTNFDIPTVQQYLRMRELDPWVFEQMSPEVPEERRLRITHAKQLLEVKEQNEQRKIYDATYVESGGGIHSKGRTLKLLVAEKRTVAPKRKKDHRKMVARSVQGIVFSTLKLGDHEDLFESHLILMSQRDAVELTSSLRKAQAKMAKLLAIADKVVTGAQ